MLLMLHTNAISNQTHAITTTYCRHSELYNVLSFSLTYSSFSEMQLIFQADLGSWQWRQTHHALKKRICLSDAAFDVTVSFNHGSGLTARSGKGKESLRSVCLEIEIQSTAATVAERGTAAPVTIFPELIHIWRNLFWKWSLGNESVFRLITGKISISSVGSPEISGAQQL